MNPITIDGHDFARSIGAFSFPAWHRIADMAELEKLGAFRQLRTASFSGSGLDDLGLRLVCRVTRLENLNLQQTLISDQGLAALAGLPGLKTLRLKENPQLSNACVPHLLRLPQLIELQIHETGIDGEGLSRLSGLHSLQDLCLDEQNTGGSRETVLALSSRLPGCRILVKGQGLCCQGAWSDT